MVHRLVTMPLRDPFAFAGITIYVLFALGALFADQLAPLDPMEILFTKAGKLAANVAPSADFPLGTTNLGRDIYAQLIHGTRSALDRPAAHAWLVGNICWHPDLKSLTAALSDPNWQPLEQAHALGDGGCPVPASAEPASQLLIDDRSTDVKIDLRLRRDGWLVVADTLYPGWSATLDGNPAYVYPVNLAFGAVPVPPGDHLVEFVYRPVWLLPGILISVVSLLITLLLFRLRQADAPEDRVP